MSASVENTTAVPTSFTELPAIVLPSGGQSAPGSTVQNLESWVGDFRKYEAMLQEATKASVESKFKAELDTIEQWFKVLSEPQRTASVHTLLKHSNQDQIRFYLTVLQQMIQPEATKADSEAAPSVDSAKIKQGPRSVRPPSLNLPDLGSPTTPTATPVTAKDSAAFTSVDVSANRLAGLRVNDEQPEEHTEQDEAQGIAGLPGLGMMSPYHLNMIANAGLSKEAQLLAVQLVMSGIVQPVGSSGNPNQRSGQGKKPSHLGETKNWRTPTSAKYPGSALRAGGLRAAAALKSAGLKSASLPSAGLPSAGLQSAGLKSSGLDSASVGTPREEDFQPEMLNDIPMWLRSLRLHKYTSCFDGLTWQEIVVLDDTTLEARGVAALGARRRLLRTFEFVRKRMGMESPDSATPTTSALPKLSEIQEDAVSSSVPKSATPTSKLSIASPVFVPLFERGPQSAAATVSVPESENATKSE